MVGRSVPGPPYASQKFGHGMLQYFCLDPNYINLNNGSFGSLPHPVRIAYDALSLSLESNPDLFIRRQLKPRIAEVRSRLAELIGAERDECVMVQNVASGINTVLRNFPWKSEDRLIMPNTTFHTISRAVFCTSDLNPHPSVHQYTLNFPASHSEILSQFREQLQAAKRVDASTTSLPEHNVVVLFDSINSMPGIMMPWKEMVKICKEEGAWSIVDAAHSLGQELDIDLSAVDPDFWISNCNKWLYAKRGCAVLYVPKRHQHLIKYTFPPGIGNASPSNDGVPKFVSEFHWSGSTDVITALTVNAALDFRNDIGGDQKIIQYCRSLARDGGNRLAEIMDTHVMDSHRPAGELMCSMVNVALPLSGDIQPSPEISKIFDRGLLEERNIYASVFYHNGGWWTRVSAQIYNEIRDFEKLGEALVAVCREIRGGVEGLNG